MSKTSLLLLSFLLISALSLPVFAQGNVKNLPAKDEISLKNFRFDVGKGEPALPPGLRGKGAVPGKHGWYVVKFKDRDNAAARARLSAGGVRFYGYVPVNSFFAKLPPGKKDAVASDPAVEFVAEYHPAYRLEKRLLDTVSKGERGARKLVLQAFDGEDLARIRGEIEKLGGSVEVIADGPGLNQKFLGVELDARRLEDLASLDGVLWVEEEKAPVLHNDVSKGIVHADYLWGLGVPLRGTGQVVAVCDTGLDTGDTSTVHRDFNGDTSDGYPKIKQTFTYGRPGNWSDTGDGHGTHVAGSVLGFGEKSNELVPGTYMRGMAYDARLVFQSTLTVGGGLGIPDLNTVLFPDAYGAGARVHTNSWGIQYSNGSYTYSASMSDTYAWNHKDFLILFSAGNDGADLAPADGIIDYGSVSSPSTAKNVISVGASEHDRVSIPTQYGVAIPNGNFDVQPIKTDKMADNPSGMVAFSGRGPCDDGRIKPDIVAPGTYVVSARSSVASGGTNPSKYEYPASLDPYYSYKSGTSMSAPLTAGSAALVREYLANKGMTAPSSALLKCIIIAGAYDMTPGQYQPDKKDVTARPDNNQGWGRVDLKESLYPDLPKRLCFDDRSEGLATGGTASYSFNVADASVPVRVNVAWTDYPGSTSATPNIVNDLDLIVTAPDGSVYHGNRYTGSGSTPDDPAFDRLNNVEGVTVPASSMTTGTMTLQVSAYNVPFGPQPFALVVTGGFSGPPSVSGVSPGSGVNNVATAVTISGSGFTAGARAYAGGTQMQVGAVTSGSIDATVPAGLAAGLYDVKVVNPDTQYATLAQAFEAVQDTAAPSSPQGLVASPADASINLRWKPNPEPDVTGYRVYFGGYSTATGAQPTHRLTSLTNGQNYEVYVKAVDAARNVSAASNTAEATPLAAQGELPHLSWNGSGAWGCTLCHVTPSGGLLPQGFDYKTDAALCMSCHNPAAVAHGKPVSLKGSHKTLVNVTSGTARRPTYGSVTSGEYSDTMYSNLKGGDKIVCATCHNTMRKPNDAGRAWEYTSTQDNRKFKPWRGGWWDREYGGISVHHDTVISSPSLVKDREARKVDGGRYRFDEYSGTVTFTNPTTGYVYVTVRDPYLRAPGSDDTACTDCHAEATHQGVSCLSCHGAHGTVNAYGIKSKVRKPGGVFREVIFKGLSGINSFAGEPGRTGICEVCHTTTLYHRYDGTGAGLHQDGINYDRKDCTACHTHAGGFN